MGRGIPLPDPSSSGREKPPHHTTLMLHAVTNGNELCKYVTDTCVIIPVVNIDSRSTEIRNTTDRARNNHLKLNLAKRQEIIFVDKRKKANFSMGVFLLYLLC